MHSGQKTRSVLLHTFHLDREEGMLLLLAEVMVMQIGSWRGRFFLSHKSSCFEMSKLVFPEKVIEQYSPHPDNGYNNGSL